MAATDRYTILSSDCHAGGSHEMYRSYLDPDLIDEFDAWREKYKNPFRDLQDGGRIRNWDDERRIGDLERDGIVGEVVFPNTVPPFFPSFVLFARPPKPDEYEHRLPGVPPPPPPPRRSPRPGCFSRARRSPTSTSTGSRASAPTTAGWPTSARANPSGA